MYYFYSSLASGRIGRPSRSYSMIGEGSWAEPSLVWAEPPLVWVLSSVDIGCSILLIDIFFEKL